MSVYVCVQLSLGAMTYAPLVCLFDSPHASVPSGLTCQVSVERPDRVGREQILRVHLQRRELPLSEDVSVESLASATTGFTGADLANLVNEVYAKSYEL